MSDNKPITGNLRSFLEGALYNSPSCFDRATVLCDYIDAIHKKLEDDHKELEGECSSMRDFCERVEQAAQVREDLTLWGTDYTALPLDADGVPIHVGDELYIKTRDRVGKVSCICLRSTGWEIYWFGWRPLEDYEFHHYHKPTVEDVLREFAQAMAEHSDMYVSEAIDADERDAADEEAIERFAKRLQLADGDDDE